MCAWTCGESDIIRCIIISHPWKHPTHNFVHTHTPTHTPLHSHCHAQNTIPWVCVHVWVHGHCNGETVHTLQCALDVTLQHFMHKVLITPYTKWLPPGVHGPHMSTLNYHHTTVLYQVLTWYREGRAVIVIIGRSRRDIGVNTIATIIISTVTSYREEEWEDRWESEGGKRYNVDRITNSLN